MYPYVWPHAFKPPPPSFPIQVSISVVGSDYASPPGDRLVGVAEIEFTLEEEQDDNCSDVIACMFEGGGACGWSLGEHATFTDTLTNGL